MKKKSETFIPGTPDYEVLAKNNLVNDKKFTKKLKYKPTEKPTKEDQLFKLLNEVNVNTNVIESKLDTIKFSVETEAAFTNDRISTLISKVDSLGVVTVGAFLVAVAACIFALVK